MCQKTEKFPRLVGIHRYDRERYGTVKYGRMRRKAKGTQGRTSTPTMEFNEQAKYENMTLSPIRNLSGREFHTGTRISSTENYLDTKN